MRGVAAAVGARDQMLGGASEAVIGWHLGRGSQHEPVAPIALTVLASEGLVAQEL